MCLLLGGLGLAGCAFFGRRALHLDGPGPGAPRDYALVIAVVGLVSGSAALATGLRGVRAWQQSAPLAAAWFWPGLAGCVLQGVAISGGTAAVYFLGSSPITQVPAWIIMLVMIGGGGIPLLGALCCAGAWWVARERTDALPVAELR
jgi:hypothetical protein